jgi:hypothetical protein
MIDLGVDLEGVDNIGPKVQTGVENYLLDGAQAGQNFAMEVVPEDRGTLRMSMAQFTPEIRNGEVIWGTQDVAHARPMEFGTDPFHPPLEPLLEWSKRVTGDEGLGYYVALHKIPNEGIDSQPYLRPGAEVQKEWYQTHNPSDYIEDELG